MKIITLPLLLAVVFLAACGATTPPTPVVTPIALMGDEVVITAPMRMELVRVPAGEFLMGSDPATAPHPHEREQPQHRVVLAEYYIGKYEVTNAQYADFLKAAGYTHRSFTLPPSVPPHDWAKEVTSGKGDYPATFIGWHDAAEFASWLSQQTGVPFRLCSEAEWEKACRGSDGSIYPWGDNAPDTQISMQAFDITPVGSFSPQGDSPYDVADMIGNATEWVADLFDEDYYATSPSVNPQGPKGGFFSINERVLRGASDTCADRWGSSGEWSFEDGFRVCASSSISTEGQ